MEKVLNQVRIVFYWWGRFWHGVRFTSWLLEKIVLGAIFALLLWDLIDLIGPPGLRNLEQKITETYPFSVLFYGDPVSRGAQARITRARFQQAVCRHVHGSNYCPLCGKRLTSKTWGR